MRLDTDAFTGRPLHLSDFFKVMLITVIWNLNDNITLFDIITFLGILAVGLVILLQEGCDPYKSQRQVALGRERTQVPDRTTYVGRLSLRRGCCVRGW